MEFLHEYGLFLIQTVTVVVAVLVVLGAAVALGQKQRGGGEGHIEVRKLNQRYDDFRDTMQHAVLAGAGRKRQQKAAKRRAKEEAKRSKHATDGGRARLYVLNFDGDIRASAADNLREEISAVLGLARPEDEVLLRLESSGGLVHSYGFAASQLQRLRDANVALTVAVDKVAASGGYMMACVANRILAAPFAVIGSVGVVAQLPNVYRLLRKSNVDVELLTAGQYKRTLTVFGENTEADRAKMQQEIDETHRLFKDFVADHRNQVDIAEVATGEVWYGQRALERGLVDGLQTSDDFIQSSLDERDVFEVLHVRKKSWQEKLGLATEAALERGLLKLWQAATRRRPF